MIGGGTSLAWWLLVAYVGLSTAVAYAMRARLARRMQTLSSVLASFREGDFSVRARASGALTRRALEDLNQLGDVLRSHRLSELEAWGLLRKVMAEVDVVVLAFTHEGQLRLANEAAARTLRQPATALLGRDARSIGVADLLEGEVPRVIKDSDVLGAGPWELRRGAFRLAGEVHSLVVLADVGGALREEERQAWKRLIRVMGHEINNSLAPIQSISESLQRSLAQSPRPEGWEEDVSSGLSVVARRADALGRFMTAYAELARLPPPKRATMDVAEWVNRAAKLERRLAVAVEGGPAVRILGDADQLDHLLINLLKNAVEATTETGRGGVRVRWGVGEGVVEVVVEDDGPGISNTANLFVPFFTTKAGGSGIGLALSRQIAEAHGGRVLLRARPGGGGAHAIVKLPLR
jgi:nitrogen fixation/metabolism regulation signal transduction histidine kinase